jgi:hypothetical protein
MLISPPLQLPSIPNRAIKCCLLYPDHLNFPHVFERAILPFLKERFYLEYKTFPYQNIDRNLIQSVRTELREPCILIFAFYGEITLELSYKLGIAHAHDARVVLIDFRKNTLANFPNCINYDFLIQGVRLNSTRDNNIDEFFEKINSLMILCLSEDIREFLYEKAVALCEALEARSGCTIAKVDKTTFSKRIKDHEISECLDNYNKSTGILLFSVVKDVRALSQVLLGEDPLDGTPVIDNLDGSANLTSNFPIQIVANISNTNTQQKEQAVSEIKNDLRGANIANFANEVKDNARQQANQYNSSPENQSLAEAAKEIQSLIEQLSQTYPTDTMAEKNRFASAIVHQIDANPSLSDRILSASKAGGVAALEQFLNHPLSSFVIGAIEDWQKTKTP